MTKVKHARLSADTFIGVYRIIHKVAARRFVLVYLALEPRCAQLALTDYTQASRLTRRLGRRYEARGVGVPR